MVSLSRVASRLLFCVFVLSLVSISLVAFGDLGLQPGPATPPDPRLDTRLVVVPAWMDRNGNRVADTLERKYRTRRQAGLQAPGAPAAADLLICLDHAPSPADTARYQALGARNIERWSDLVYALRARFPVSQLSPEALAQLGQDPGVLWVEENVEVRPRGFLTSRQTRARAAWAAGAIGSPNQAIAFLDSGIDGTHADFEGRVTGWADFAGVNALIQGDEYAAPTDKAGHGTAVAGLAVGSGAAGGITTGVGGLNITVPWAATFGFQSGFLFPVDTSAATSSSSLTARLRWQAIFPNTAYLLQLLDPSGGLLGGGATASTAAQPYATTFAGIPAGITSFLFQGAVSVTNDFGAFPGPGGDAFAVWEQISTPMSAAGDSFPLMRGVAAGCKIVAVKVLSDTGPGTMATMINGLTWVNANRRALSIVCVNASLGTGTESALLDSLVNQVSRNGVLWVNAAGNGRYAERVAEANGDTAGVDAPGSASKAISVGATNEDDHVTNYTSYGRVGQRKPDLVAPGGSDFTGRSLVVVDSNSADADRVTDPSTDLGSFLPDQFANDYSLDDWVGDSFSAPQVAGTAMIMAQYLGEAPFTEAQVLRLKMLLLMTASETGVQTEPIPLDEDPAGQLLPLPPQPVLNRGEKDRVEGFGRLNADAAVEAVTQTLTLGSGGSTTLGPGRTEKKVWARNVNLTAGQAVSLTLTNPASADLDLYVYADTPITLGGSEGEPRIVASSVRPGLGGSEVLQYTPDVSGRCYVVVKFVAGRTGAFQLVGAAAPDFAIQVSPGTQSLESKGDSLTFQVTVTGLGGFNGSVTLATAGTLPAGVTPTFNPPTVSANGSSTLTLTTTAATPAGLQTVTVQGTAGNLTRTATAGLTVGAVWPRFHHDGRSSGRSAFNGPQTTRQPWLFPVGMEIFSSPAIGADDTIYFGDRDGSLNAVNPKDGTFRWFSYIESGMPVDSSPAIGFDGTIFFGADDGELYAYLPDGSQKWQVALGTDPVRSGPAIGPDGTIYVTAGGTLHAVRSVDGIRKWSFTPTGAAVTSSPTLGPDGTVYFGAGSSSGTVANRLYAVRDTGTSFASKWDFPVTGNVRSTPLVANGRLYVGADGDSAGGRLYVLTDNGTTATKFAETTTTAAVQSSPAVGPDGSVYVGCNDNNLYAFAADGTVRWRFPTGGPVVSSPAVGADGIVYFGSRDTRIYAVRDEGGSNRTQVWTVRTGAEVLASPAIGSDGTLYTPSLDGSLTAFADGARPDFVVASINPGQSAVLAGTTASYTVRLQTINGFTGPVTFQVVGTLPNGMTASFSPAQITLGSSGTGQTTLRLASTSATPAGEVLFTVRATSGSTVRDAPYASLLLADYTLAPQPTTQRVTAGQSTAFGLALLPNPTYASLPINVNAAATLVSPPSGGTLPTLALDTSSSSIPGLLTLTAATSPATLPGTYDVEVRGTSSALTRTARMKLEVAGYNLTTPQATLRVTAGNSARFTLDVASVLGFTGNVALSVSAPPAGVTAAFATPSVAAPGSSTLDLTTAATTTPGSYSVTVTGTSGAITRSVTLTLEVAGFNLTVPTATQRVTAGSTANYTLNVQSVLGFAGDVALTLSAPPTGVTPAFTPGTVAGGSGTAALALATAPETAPGSYSLTLTGTSGTLTRSVTLTLEVAGFTATVATSTATVTAGSAATYTVNIASLFGFNQPVTLAPSGTPPNGATLTFNPSSVTGTGASTLTVATTAATPAGAVTLSFTATAGGITRTVTVTLTVNAAP